MKLSLTLSWHLGCHPWRSRIRRWRRRRWYLILYWCYNSSSSSYWVLEMLMIGLINFGAPGGLSQSRNCVSSRCWMNCTMQNIWLHAFTSCFFSRQRPKKVSLRFMIERKKRESYNLWFSASSILFILICCDLFLFCAMILCQDLATSHHFPVALNSQQFLRRTKLSKVFFCV